ncbi:hypothetical protein RMSM_03223 [Rhodopirellula maiorica SM1]|uniref:Uncharacterized protein n=1 Tax=Rhodopirellula maiorica SM1 TaxID=1265738 RepID=M5S0Z7_9BACT|nr:hypothetical protein RMSM_03223 [Rhodopirellula maiorica SM1]
MGQRFFPTQIEPRRRQLHAAWGRVRSITSWLGQSWQRCPQVIFCPSILAKTRFFRSGAAESHGS